MKLLILGRGKTGSLIAEIARERGHLVTTLGSADNPGAAALTPAFLAPFDAVIDFTTPEAVAANLEACLAAGARVVVGTTGWYPRLPALRALALACGARLLYGTNFSVGVQAFFRAAKVLAESLPGYAFTIDETHHAAKKDAPSGTALTLQQVVKSALTPEAEVPVSFTRTGDVPGTHVLEARSASDHITLRHQACSRHGFAEGAVLAAEWLVSREEPAAVWDFAQIASQL
ncbi:MAG TPA: dihydrodipicolinate reductase C-terminal domain-containing protein [Acidobacteriaceae bacterium]